MKTEKKKTVRPIHKHDQHSDQEKTALDWQTSLAEERFRAITNNSFDIITILNRDGLVVSESKATRKILGL